ncbi:small acid-soluble spore protein Tlp [Lysinibacillus sp. BW-2-10]|uniref:small acid-soluble spore protein Tlp n=1 Tax=Lysinibacillus sp. BW-2-10 TaxID=2590030 RepID=UPI00117EEC4D|nr:small acid-soluble spore protein Tlp [Lysinibacillus sp. BW-2-10]TSI09681.1 small acid-soluble spore protein Tlp [Lysinibacillus sp. BW-2-10]
MSKQNQPNPDNRQNNVERLQEMVENTENKIHETEISMEFASPEEQQRMKEKNARRQHSIAAMKDEIQDEMNGRKNSGI